MVIVKKGNRELRIDDVDLQEYLNKGYDAISSDGKVINVGNSNKLADVIFERDAALQVIKHRDKEIAALKAKLEALEKQVKGTKPTKPKA